MPVVLVRHAQALPRSAWEGDDRERVLSERGRKQSRLLVAALRGYKPRRILSSPYLRCMETVGPLAKELGLEVEPEEALAEACGPDALKLVRSLAAERVVLCTHGDIIPEVLQALSVEDGLALGRNPRFAKSSAWVLDHGKGRFVKATYVRAPA
jgi:phosphohistidine phosphatase SixA